MKHTNIPRLISAARAGFLCMSVLAAALLPVAARAQSPIADGGIYRLFNVRSALVLETPGTSATNGIPLDQWQVTGGTGQYWRAVSLAGGLWEFVDEGNNTAVTVNNNSLASGAKIVQSAAIGAAAQQWQVAAVGDGSYKIVSQLSGKLMQLSVATATNGGLITQGADSSVSKQHWMFEQVTGLPAPVYSGGTWSDTVLGYHDMSVSSNTSSYRALGGGLYIHPNGWDPTSSTDKPLVYGLFPGRPIYETAASSDPNSSIQFYNTRLKQYWPSLAGVTVNFLDTQTTTNIQQLVATYAGISPYVAPIVGPNANATDATTYPWGSAHWDHLRTAAMIGGAVSTDAPPYYYFAREEAYRVWIASCIKWANLHNLQTVMLVFPGSSADFLQDTTNYIADLKSRGAVPTQWAFDGYYGNTAPPPPPHPMGSETNPPDQNYTALNVLQAGN